MAKRSYVRGGGHRQTNAGYIEVWRPKHPLAMSTGYVLEHRMLAWDAGLLTDPAHEVHHQNEIRDDNRLENLIVKESSRAHMLEHHVAPGQSINNQYGSWVVGAGITKQAREKKLLLGQRTCEQCGSDIPEKTRSDARFCTSNCRISSWKTRHSK